MKRARPQGLGTANKKEKFPLDKQEGIEFKNDDTVLTSTSNNFDDSISGATEKLIFELPEEATALDQLKALFESANMCLGNNSISLLFKFKIDFYFFYR